MSTSLILQILALLGLGGLGWLIRYYLAPYSTEKGKNLATKQDIAEITGRIEGVKAEYDRELEGVRAAIDSKLGIH